MSHAFVEVEDEIIAGKILRGEVQANGLRRGSVLGKGKRARGVTVTRSSQGELMSAVRIIDHYIAINTLLIPIMSFCIAIPFLARFLRWFQAFSRWY